MREGCQRLSIFLRWSTPTCGLRLKHEWGWKLQYLQSGKFESPYVTSMILVKENSLPWFLVEIVKKTHFDTSWIERLDLDWDVSCPNRSVSQGMSKGWKLTHRKWIFLLKMVLHLAGVRLKWVSLRVQCNHSTLLLLQHWWLQCSPSRVAVMGGFLKVISFVPFEFILFRLVNSDLMILVILLFGCWLWFGDPSWNVWFSSAWFIYLVRHYVFGLLVKTISLHLSFINHYALWQN